MSDVAIRVENLGKQYRIGGRQERYRTLRDALVNAATAPFQRAGKLLRGQASGAAGLDETIWALKGVSFEVKRGEVVGIIGANGAGKSTLLKILSRITEPTEGYVDLHGRVGSLLEVGTGFHPELTGRENIYFNGAILGMTREGIDQRFDEIVDFSGVEKFIDTPVKHYSSGMGLRLGFAVAAHLEADILVVDEVLAVGDAAFQKKCLGKMSEVAGGGRTVLFVSHNMATIQKLCGSAIYLKDGRIRLGAAADKAVEEYLTETAESSVANAVQFPVFDRTGDFGIRGIEVDLTETPTGSSELRVKVSVVTKIVSYSLGVGIGIMSNTGIPIGNLDPIITGHTLPELPGEYGCIFSIPDISKYLSGGDYRISVWLAYPGISKLVRLEGISSFSIPLRDLYSTGLHYSISRHGVVPLPATVSTFDESNRQVSLNRPD